MQPHKRKVTPDEAIRILKEHGTIITIKEAELMLDFLYKFGKLTLDSIFKSKNDFGSMF